MRLVMANRSRFLPLVAFLLLVLSPVVLLGWLRVRSAGTRVPEQGISVERLPDCPERIEIVVDGVGIPHVRALSRDGLFFAQGWLHARERFFQMELARRAAAGRLAELFGEAALATDRKMRTWRLDATARRQLAVLGDDERHALNAYADGVNAALARFGRWIAPEIWLLDSEPEPWHPEDTLRVGMLLQLHLSWAMGEELHRSVTAAALGVDRATELWGWTSAQARAWVPPGEMVALPRQPDDAITPTLSGIGSNSWVIGPERTRSGRPLLANDPHLGVQIPSTWYVVHLDSPELHVAGASIPGAPGVLVGHNERVAWGLTMAMLDDQDLYVLTLDDARAREMIDGAWQPLRTVSERIEVRWRPEPELLKIRLSERGPVVRESPQALALSWVALHGPSPIGAFLAMAEAQSAVGVAEVWRETLGPAMHLVAADVDGHILHQVVGAAPERRRGAGRLPAPGNDSRWAWQGFRALDEGHRRIDPVHGYVASANHDPFAEDELPRAEPFPGEFAPPWRVRRIRQLLAAEDGWDVAACRDLQGDVVSLRAKAVLEALGADLERDDGAVSRRLRGWDGSMPPASVEARLYHELVLRLQEEVGGDEAADVGLEASPFTEDLLLDLLRGERHGIWWDDVATEAREVRATILGTVLDDLERRVGDGTWGDVHRVTFRHRLADAPVIGTVVAKAWSRGPFPVGGDGATVNAHYWDAGEPFDVTAIPSMRLVTDVGAWDRSIIVVPPGQSGRPWSRHYDGQVTAWLGVEAFSFPFSLEAVDQAATVRLLLAPEAETR